MKIYGKSWHTITLSVVTAAIMAITVSGIEKKLPAKKPTEQTAEPAESHDEEAVIQQPLAGAIEGKNGKQNQRAALATQPGVAAADWQPYGNRYAIIVMGDGSNSDKSYWPACTSMYRYLLEIGFIRENIRFLAPSRYARGHPDIVSGEASETRIEQAYQWARSTCTQADLLYVYWISHGASSYFTTARNPVRHSTLASWMKGIKARQIIGVYEPCYSGAVVDDISGENIITLTSTDPNTVNVWPWAENIAFALAGPRHCDRWINPNHNYNLEPARYYVDQDGDGKVSVTEAYIWVAKHGYAEGSMLDDNGDGVGGQWMTDTFDPYDPDRDGYIGNHYSLIGWKPSSITLREYGHESRKTIASARKIVDELYENDGLYCNVIDKLKADKTLDEPVSKVALKIAHSRKWQDVAWLTTEGWEIVSSADKDTDTYESVLEKARKVAGSEPCTPSTLTTILTTLGVAQYRVGACADALDTLKQAEKMRRDSNLGPDPNSAVAAFTKMQSSLEEADSHFAFSLEGLSKLLSRACYARGKSRLLDNDQGYIDRASDYESAISDDPNYVSALKDLAWLQTTCPVKKVRNFTKAVELATQACELTDWKNHECISTLAAAYSETGDFDAAVKWQKTATALLLDDCPTALRANYEARCGVYQSHKPYHKGSLWSFSSGELVAYWSFDNVEGDTVLDSSGNALHGRLVGDARVVSDPERGHVLSLGGEGDHVDCGRNAAFNITGSITVAAWTKVKEFKGVWQALVAKSESWGLARTWDSEVMNFGRTFTTTDETNRWIGAVGESDVNDGKWHHTVGVYDGARISLYVDGRLEGVQNAPINTTINDYSVQIGATEEDLSNWFWCGLVDDVRIYSYALTADEVKDLYEGREPPREKESE